MQWRNAMNRRQQKSSSTDLLSWIQMARRSQSTFWLSRANWALQLLKSVEQGKIDRAFISASHARQINDFNDRELSEFLGKVWGKVRKSSADRVAEMSKLREKLTSREPHELNLKRGRMVYEKQCANCHTLFGTGGKIGPDLTGSDRKNLNYLLENILDPSASGCAKLSLLSHRAR